MFQVEMSDRPPLFSIDDFQDAKGKSNTKDKGAPPAESVNWGEEAVGGKRTGKAAFALKAKKVEERRCACFRTCFARCKYCLCEPGGCCARCFSITLWCNFLTGWLNRCAKRSVVTTYNVLEVLVCGASLAALLMHPSVAKLGFLLDNSFLLNIIIIFRGCCAILGTYASCQRKRGRMTYYVMFYWITNPMFCFVGWPFAMTTCYCRRYCLSEQWDVLHSFQDEPAVSDAAAPRPTTLVAGFAQSRLGRLVHDRVQPYAQGDPDAAAAAWAWESRPSAPLLADSETVEETLGNFNITDPGIYFYPGTSESSKASGMPDALICSTVQPTELTSELMYKVREQLERLQCNVHDELDEVILGPLSVCANSRACLAAEIHFTTKDIRVCGIDGGGNPATRLKPLYDQRLGELSKLCKRSCTGDEGIPLILREWIVTEVSPLEGWVKTVYARVDAKVVEGDVLFKIAKPTTILPPFIGYDVEVKSRYNGTISAVLFKENDNVKVGDILVNITQKEQAPKLPDCREFKVLLMKPTVTMVDKLPILDEEAELQCRVFTHGVAILIAVLLVLSIPMSVILVKYIRNHCGDYIPESDLGDDQWGVEPDAMAAGNSDSSDDFKVGTFVSLHGRDDGTQTQTGGTAAELELASKMK